MSVFSLTTMHSYNDCFSLFNRQNILHEKLIVFGLLGTTSTFVLLLPLNNNNINANNNNNSNKMIIIIIIVKIIMITRVKIKLILIFINNINHTIVKLQ